MKKRMWVFLFVVINMFLSFKVFAAEIIFKTSPIGTYEQNISFSVDFTNHPINGSYNVLFEADGRTLLDNDIKISENDKVKSFYINEKLLYGFHDIKVLIKQNGSELLCDERKICVMDLYTHQFMDELSGRGVCTHFLRNVYNQNQPALIDLMNCAGYKWMRDEKSWWGAESENGVYNLSDLKSVVQYAGDRGIKSHLLAVYGSSIHIPEEGINKNEMVYGEFDKIIPKTQESIYAYAEYAQEMVELGDDLQIWNEPNISFNESYVSPYEHLEQKASSYSDLFNATAAYLFNKGKYDIGLTGIEAANSETGCDFAQMCYDNGIYPYITTVSYHPYVGENGFANGFAYNRLKMYSDLVSDNGGWKELSLTETGFSSAQVNDEKAAEGIVKTYASADAFDIDKVFIYELMDESDLGNEIESNWGTVNSDLTPKKMYMASAQMNKKTSGALFLGDVELDLGNDAHCYMYNRSGKPVAVAWLEGDTRQIISFGNERLTISDIYGNITDENTNVVTISSKPVFIEGFGKAWFQNAVRDEVVSENHIWIEKFADMLNPEDIQMLYDAENILTDREMDAEDALEINNLYAEFGNVILSYHGRIENREISQMLFELYKIMKNINNLYITLYEGESKQDLESSYESSKLFSDRYRSRVYSKPYSDAILKFAGRYYNDALTVMGLEDDLIKAGVIDGWDKMSGILSEWYDVFASFEDLKNIGLLAQAAHYDKIAGEDTDFRLALNLNNWSKDAFSGRIEISDGEGNPVCSRDVSLPSDGGYKKETFLIPGEELSGIGIKEFYVRFIDENGAGNSIKIDISVKEKETYPIEAGYFHKTQIINITGRLPEKNNYSDEPVTLVIYEDGRLTYIDQTAAYDNGEYFFNFKYRGNVDNIKIFINMCGTVINDTVLRAVSESEAVGYSFQAVRNGDIISLLIKLQNDYHIDDTYQAIIAFYNNKGRLTGCELGKLRELRDGSYSETENFKAQDAGYAKVFIWKSAENIKPLADALNTE